MNEEELKEYFKDVERRRKAATIDYGPTTWHEAFGCSLAFTKYDKANGVATYVEPSASGGKLVVRTKTRKMKEI